jgi:hypothetical protein
MLAGGGGEAGDLPGEDQETGQAVQVTLKRRRDASEEATPEAGSVPQLQAEVKRLKMSVHRLEDSLAVHKEYCNGIFEGLFSTLKDREAARYDPERSNPLYFQGPADWYPVQTHMVFCSVHKTLQSRNELRITLFHFLNGVTLLLWRSFQLLAYTSIPGSFLAFWQLYFKSYSARLCIPWQLKKQGVAGCRPGGVQRNRWWKS